MPIKGPLWLMSECLNEERKRGKITYLASRALDLGLGKVDKTRGHVFQACGALQKFFGEYPQHKNTVKSASPIDPYKPDGQMLRDWKRFLTTHVGAPGDGSYERKDFHYNYKTLQGYLTTKYAGTRTGGGGGDNEFEIAFRLVAEFL
jgi:hypothetical protein